jgi:hypothetical protein
MSWLPEWAAAGGAPAILLALTFGLAFLLPRRPAHHVPAEARLAEA